METKDRLLTGINELGKFIDKNSYDQVIVLTDKNTKAFCLPLLMSECPFLEHCATYVIEPEDEHKTPEALIEIWRFLSRQEASRSSLLILLGGGVVTDLGGMAAATFHRGMDFVNIPTTLLGMVDASTGGKTAVNLDGVKNQVGVFKEPKAVILDSRFLDTLPDRELKSGYAEIIKHALLTDRETFLHFTREDAMEDFFKDHELMNEAIRASILKKTEIVDMDPLEKGPRKALNLGHTIGHALESFSLRIGEEVPHGYAVAWGLVAELYLSMAKLMFPKDLLRRASYFIKDHYEGLDLGCQDYDMLYDLMKKDKKNHHARINFTLLRDAGSFQIDQQVSKEDVFESLDFLRECLGF